MEIEVREARGGDLFYWLRSLVGTMGKGASITEDRDAPAVIARSRLGGSHVLLRTSTTAVARRRAEAFRVELARAGAAEFVKKYRLPQSFAE